MLLSIYIVACDSLGAEKDLRYTKYFLLHFYFLAHKFKLLLITLAGRSTHEFIYNVAAAVSKRCVLTKRGKHQHKLQYKVFYVNIFCRNIFLAL